jgi:hypothetical protein
MQKKNRSIAAIRPRFFETFSLRFHCPSQKMPTSGNVAASRAPVLAELAIGAVVETVIVTTESSFPTGTGARRNPCDQ